MYGKLILRMLAVAVYFKVIASATCERLPRHISRLFHQNKSGRHVSRLFHQDKSGTAVSCK